ncbi:MAG: ABC transporter ATP-binding protein [Nanoarchaeota archaeon]|nr:ABC transporter ATP-binding protein [Nanoarchaeota archaeon]
MAEPIFRIEHVSKGFGNHVVLDDLSLDIYAGEIIGVIGASGAGKTTFLHTMIGFLKPDKGDVLFRQDHLLSYRESYIYRSVFKKQNIVKHVFGFASQIPSFYEELTTKENLEYFGSLHNLSSDAIKTNTDTLLTLMDLKEASDVKAKNLSGGMERRLDIACALMHDPDVLILDEPTADLDPLLRNHIWELVRKINQKGTTIILSSHHLTELESLCDRVAIIKEGKLIALGKPEELKKKFILKQEIALQTVPGKYKEIADALKKKHITDIEIKNNLIHIHTTSPEKTLSEVLATLSRRREKLAFIKVTSASLDDVFISIWKKDKKEDEK